MAKDLLNYQELIDDALRGVIRTILARVAQTGLPGNHHFFITFRTDHPHTRIPPRLAAQYPEEMMIVLQHRFYGLEVGEDAFSVTLSFGGVPERLTVPYDAIVLFADPSVDLARPFEPKGMRGEAGEAAGEVKPWRRRNGLGEPQDSGGRGAPARDGAPGPSEEDEDPPPRPPSGGGEVVSLDRFRKK